MGDDGSSSSSSPARVTSLASDLSGDLYHSPIYLKASNQEQLMGESMSTEWTDEKHSLYLKSMEASFVNDMYNSFDLLGYQIQHPSDPKSSRRKHTGSRTSSGQFKVIQRGCWEKINFERNRSRSDKVDGPTVLLASPWIRHFRSSRGRQIVASSTLHEKVALAADLSSYDSVEVTDQNFVDEEVTGEESSHMCNAKRIKTSIAPNPLNYQVVPLAKFSGSSDVANHSCI